MQTFRRFFWAIIFILTLTNSAFSQRSICAASPYPIEVVQPDGSKLTVVTIGNEMLNYRETVEGYTMLSNHEGIYEYAVLDSKGNLQLSGIKAKNNISESTLNKTLPQKHLRFSTIQQQAIQQDFAAFQSDVIEMNKTVEVNYPTMGDIRIIAICMQFPDEAALYPTSAVSDLLNQPNYNSTGSFRDYFLANSYGKLRTQVDVFGWYTTALNRESYGRNLNNGTVNAAYNANVRNLVRQAIDSADIKGNANFALYDNDSNGSVEGIILFHAGYGAEQGLNGYIWSHRSSLPSTGAPVKDGKTIRNYCVNPIKRNWSGTNTMVGLGVLAHEFGHIMGLPDLYDTGDNSEGIGNYGLMGGCGWLNQERTPCQYESWSKDQFGWLNPIVINTGGDYELKHTLDTAICYRINTARANEYFLLENRQQKGWDRFLPSRGLAIWHINTQRTSLYPGSNTVNTDTAQLGVGLKQADGQRNLERGTNRGDAGDLYPGSTSNTSFNNFTNPSSKLHYKIGGVNQASNVSISNITQRTNDSVIVFRLGLANAAVFSPSIATGCAPLKVTLNNFSTNVNSFKWFFPDNSTDTTTLSPQFTFTKPGQNVVSLVLYENGIVADSTSQIITVLESPKASISYTQIGDQVIIKNTTAASGTFHQWKIGAGSTSSLDSVSLTVPSSGLTVTLYVFGSNGCTDSIARNFVPFTTGLENITAIQGISVYPNPFSQQFDLNYTLTSSTSTVITLYNVLGKEVYQEYKPTSNGQQTVHIPLSENLNTGIYFLTLRTETETKTIRVLKSK